MEDFYAQILRQLLEQRWLSLDSSVLVVCGGMYDRDIFHCLGFKHVTISNLDPRMTADAFAPYPWSHQDVESLSYGDAEFDFVVVHQGLHHCYSPHRGLLEMYRVASKGVLVFEPRDTALVRLGVKFSFGQEYEVAAVAGNGLKYGGVRNTAVPNYVYRWTEREVKKSIAAYSPIGRFQLQYFYALRIPEERLNSMKSRFVAHTLRLLLPSVRLFAFLFPRQTNCFACAIRKPELPAGLHPWLLLNKEELSLNEEWVTRHYNVGKTNSPAARRSH